VAIREPVLEAASDEPTMRADGGTTVEVEEEDHSDERPDECDCLLSMKDLPCWSCYRDGFKEPDSNRVKPNR
jgi:hypothetical protein